MKNTKKIIITILVLLTITLIIAPNVAAWDDCPYGFEEDQCPGTCWRYIDTNNDEICDHSQEEPATSRETTEQESSSEAQGLNKNANNQNNVLKIIILSFIIVLILIIITQLLKKSGKLSNTKEKIIWNLLLLIFFLPSAITGIILALTPTIPALREIGLNFVQLHNITSFFFMWISGYHIIWHTKYYVKGVKRLIKK